MDAYQTRSWKGWHHHIALSLIAGWFLIGEIHQGQLLTPALTLPQVRYGLSLFMLEAFRTPDNDYICRQVQPRLQRYESAPFYHPNVRHRPKETTSAFLRSEPYAASHLGLDIGADSKSAESRCHKATTHLVAVSGPPVVA